MITDKTRDCDVAQCNKYKKGNDIRKAIKYNSGRSKKEGLIIKEKRTLKYITAYIKKYGYAPSNKEIAEGAKIPSGSTVCIIIKELIKQGKLETSHNGIARAYKLANAKIIIE